MSEAIPTEPLGRARDFIRRAEAEYVLSLKLLANGLEPLKVRKARYPRRKFRPEHLHAFAYMAEATPHTFRLWLECTYPKPTNLEIFEIRVTSGRLNRSVWDDGGFEPNLFLANTIVNIGTRAEDDITKVLTHAVSLHGLARRYERCSEWEDAAVLRDLTQLTQLQPDDTKHGETCAIPTSAGEWRGIHSHMKRDSGGFTPVIAMRTWVHLSGLRSCGQPGSCWE